MADANDLDRLERWAERVLEDVSTLPEDMPEGELRERQARWYADYFALAEGSPVGGPDDPAMRTWLIEEEGMSPDFADEVLAKMKELVAAQ